MGDWLSWLQNLWGSGSSSLGSALGNPNQGGLVSLLQLLGIGSGAYSAAEGSDWLNYLTNAQKSSINTAQNPGKMSGLIDTLFQGMNPSQNRAILGPVEQAAAARGQSGSPGTMQILSEQALAPYFNQEYQQAAQEAENGLSLPFNLRQQNFPSFSPVGDMGGSLNPNTLAALLGGGNPFGSVSTNVSNFADPLNLETPQVPTGWGMNP